MTSRPINDQVLAALICLGAIAASNDQSTHTGPFANHVLGMIDNADLRRALQYILARDGGDHFLARVVQNLRRLSNQPLPDALEDLEVGPVIVSASSIRPRGRVA